jgi:DNA-binding TFAR19-related protein (PDSD5 family)
MEDEEAEGIEQLKRKRLEARKMEEQLKSALRSVLDEAAYDRLMNVSVANKELYIMAAKNLLAAAKQARRKITDAELLSFLRAIKEQTETKTSITFHKK